MTNPFGDAPTINPYGDTSSQPQGEQLPVGTEMGGLADVAGVFASGAAQLPVKAASGYAGFLTLVAEKLNIADEGEAARLISDWQEAVTYKPKTQAGQRKLQNFLNNPAIKVISETAEELGTGVRDYGADVAEFSGSPAMGALSATPFLGIPEAAEAGTASVAGVSPLYGLAKGAKATARQLPQSQRKQEIGRQLATGQAAPETAGYRLMLGDEEVKRRNLQDVPQYIEGLDDVNVSEYGNFTSEVPQTDLSGRQLRIEKNPLSKRLITQGFQPSDVSVMQNYSPNESAVARRMSAAKRGSLEGKDITPLSMVGDALKEQVSILQRDKQRAARNIKEALKDMEGVDIDYSQPLTKFREFLDNKKIKLDYKLTPEGDAKWVADTSGSVFVGDQGTDKLLNIILSRLGSITDSSGDIKASANDIHDLKKLIDYRVDYGKLPSDNTLTAQAQGLVKSLRSDLNKVLQQGSGKYKKANEDYAESIKPLAQLNEATNSKIDVMDDDLSPSKLGLELRKLAGNWTTTEDLKQSTQMLSERANSLGYDKNINIAKLVSLDSILNDRFGVSRNKKKSAEGIVRKGFGGDRLGAAKDAADSVGKKTRKLNDEEAMKDLIKMFDSQGTSE